MKPLEEFGKKSPGANYFRGTAVLSFKLSSCQSCAVNLFCLNLFLSEFFLGFEVMDTFVTSTCMNEPICECTPPFKEDYSKKEVKGLYFKNRFLSFGLNFTPSSPLAIS
jgi:hypothetical protein